MPVSTEARAFSFVKTRGHAAVERGLLGFCRCIYRMLAIENDALRQMHSDILVFEKNMLLGLDRMQVFQAH